MLKRFLFGFITILLVFTTTGSIWSHILHDEDDAIELNAEKEVDGEKGEKEAEKELDSWDDHFASNDAYTIPELYCGFQKVGSSTFAPVTETNNKLYLLYHSFKVDC